MDNPFTREQLDVLWKLVSEAQFIGRVAEEVAELKAAIKAAKGALTEEENG